MAIYVKFAEEKKPKSIKEFLIKFFNSYSQQCIRNVPTYHNKEYTILQCSADRYRSFDDIFELVQTYYKTATVGKIFKILLTLYPKNGIDDKKYNLYMMTCAGIKKINCLYVSGDNLNNLNNYLYITRQKNFTSKYTYKQLFDMIGVKNQEDLDNILKL